MVSEVSSKRPIMALLDLLSRRWTLRILWELRDDQLTSRELRSATGISPTVLQSRIDELREAGIVEVSQIGGYRVTGLGRELSKAFAPLNDFASKWARSKRDNADGS